MIGRAVVILLIVVEQDASSNMKESECELLTDIAQ